jgi:signal transduction histidine kinase
MALKQGYQNMALYEELLRIQLEIQEHSLDMIVKEIYENVGQVLSLVKLNLSMLNTAKEPEARKTATHAGDLLGKAIRDLRKISNPVTGKVISEKGLMHAIRQELDILSRINNYTNRLTMSEKMVRLDPPKELIAFRIVQESINIITDYSTTKEIDIRAKQQANAIQFAISNGHKEDSSQVITNIPPALFSEKCKQMHVHADLIGARLVIAGQPYANLDIMVYIPLT